MRIGIIPAGGKSSRYQEDYPKWSEEIDGSSLLVHQILKLSDFTDEIFVLVRENYLRFLPWNFIRENQIKIVVIGPTNSPLETLRYFSRIVNIENAEALILWADQVGVTKSLISETLLLSSDKSGFPGCFERSPYVHYQVVDGNLIKSAQTILGDPPVSIGFRDVGIFKFAAGDLNRGLKLTAKDDFLEMLCKLGCIPLNIAKIEHSIGINSKSDVVDYGMVKNTGL